MDKYHFRKGGAVVGGGGGIKWISDQNTERPLYSTTPFTPYKIYSYILLPTILHTRYTIDVGPVAVRQPIVLYNVQCTVYLCPTRTAGVIDVAYVNIVT
jgi:hypothetical protein